MEKLSEMGLTCHDNSNETNREINSVIMRLKKDEPLIPKYCPCEDGEKSFDRSAEELLTFNQRDEVHFVDARQMSTLAYGNECSDAVHQQCYYSTDGIHSTKLSAGQNRDGDDSMMSSDRFADDGPYTKSHIDHDKSIGPQSNATITSVRSKTRTDSESERQVPIVEKKRTKKRTKKETEKNNRCTRIVRSDESCRDNLMPIENSMDIAQAIYPGVHCGHKACLREPVVTPKHMGWLWSLRETGGVKINRNWKPGAIPNCVAKIMLNVKQGIAYDVREHRILSTPVRSSSKASSWTTTDAAKSRRNSVVTFDDRTNSNSNTNSHVTNVNFNSKNRSNNSNNGDNSNSESNYGGNGRNSAALKKTNALGPNNTGNKSNTFKKDKALFSVNKHGGQYGIKMNPIPVENENGEMVMPKDVESVYINLGRCFGKSPPITSQSSMSFEMSPQYGQAKRK